MSLTAAEHRILAAVIADHPDANRRAQARSIIDAHVAKPKVTDCGLGGCTRPTDHELILHVDGSQECGRYGQVWRW